MLVPEFSQGFTGYDAHGVKYILIPMREQVSFYGSYGWRRGRNEACSAVIEIAMQGCEQVGCNCHGWHFPARRTPQVISLWSLQRQVSLQSIAGCIYYSLNRGNEDAPGKGAVQSDSDESPLARSVGPKHSLPRLSNTRWLTGTLRHEVYETITSPTADHLMFFHS